MKGFVLIFSAIQFLTIFDLYGYQEIEGFHSLNKIEASQYRFQKDEIMTVLFISNDCPCSNSHMQHFNELAKKFPKITFVGVHTGEYKKVSEIEEYYRSKNLSFPVIADPEQKILKDFKALRTPHAFLLKGQDLRYSGGVSDDAHFPSAQKLYLEKALSEASQGLPVSVPHSKLNGCYIERI